MQKLLPFFFIIFSLNVFATELDGMVNIKCSGAIVDIGRRETDLAVILTNGHCVRHQMMPAQTYVENMTYVRSEIHVFNGAGKAVPLFGGKILYGTMEGLDIGLVEVGMTYRELKDQGIKVFSIAKKNIGPGEKVFTASGYWKESQTCIFEYDVPQLIEGTYTWGDAMAMDLPCIIKGGWSGSPIISVRTGEIVGVLNTGNEKGEKCLMNNPCEKNELGAIQVSKGRAYGNHVALLWNCLSSGKVDLDKASCRLYKGAKLFNPEDEHLTVAEKMAWLETLAREYPSHQIQFQVEDRDMGHISTSVLGKIYINTPILQSFRLMELVLYVCHEIGHHAGEKSFHAVGSWAAVEAEADYFAGSCVANFITRNGKKLMPYFDSFSSKPYNGCHGDKVCEESSKIILEGYTSLFAVQVIPEKAVREKFEGVNTSYPKPDCRALSAIAGLLAMERPSCWYNPKY